MASRNLEILLTGRDVSASSALRKLASGTQLTEKEMSKLASTMKTALGAAALGGLAVAFHTGLQEVKDYQSGLAQLNAGLRSTHGAANVTADGLEGLAKQVQGYSGQTDDSIVSTEALLLRFKNLRNEAGKGNDVFTRTTKIAADMAARLGGDAASQATKLGRALNDPVKGMSALTRVGVTFTDQQKKTIQSLVDSGRVLDAQKMILAQLDTQFAGSARAYGETLPGKIDIAKRHFEDMSQSLVTGLVPEMDALAKGGAVVSDALGNKGVQSAVKLSVALYAVNKAIKIGKAVRGSDIITLAKSAAGHTANAEAIAAEGAAAAEAAPALEALAVAEAGGAAGALGPAAKAGRFGGLAGAGSKALRGGLIGGGIIIGGQIAGDAIGGKTGSTVSTVGNFAGAGAGLGFMVGGPLGAAVGGGIGAAAGLASSLGGTGSHFDQTKLATKSTTELRKELEALAKTNKMAGGTFSDSAKQAQDQIKAELDSRAAAKQHASALIDDANAAAQNARSLKTLNSRLAEHTSKELAASGSADAFTEALHALRSTTKDGTRDLTGNSNAALANRDAFRGAAQAILTHIGNLKEQHKSGREVNRTLLDMAKKLRQSATDTYGNSDAVDKLLRQWGLLPSKLRKSVAKLRFEGEHAGAAFGDGLYFGMKGKEGKVGTEAGNLATLAVKQLNRAAGNASPSKKTRKSGQDMAEGLRQGWKDGEVSILRDIVKTGEKAVAAAEKSAQKMRDRISNVASRLANVQGNAASMRQGISGGIIGGADLTNAGTTNPLGLITFLTQQQRQAHAFRRNLATLQKRGLSQRLLNQLASAGPESAGEITARLATARGGTLQRLSGLERDIVSTARATGRARAVDTYGPKIDRIDGHLTDIKSEFVAMKREIHELRSDVKGDGHRLSAALDAVARHVSHSKGHRS